MKMTLDLAMLFLLSASVLCLGVASFIMRSERVGLLAEQLLLVLLLGLAGWLVAEGLLGAARLFLPERVSLLGCGQAREDPLKEEAPLVEECSTAHSPQDKLFVARRIVG